MRHYLSVSTLFFFFSSRRRHTRFDCDWSSDVCSSDLVGVGGADERVAITPEDEVDALAFMRAVVLGRLTGDATVARAATGLATQMMRARYVALVHDAEPSPHGLLHHPDRAEALIALAQALNGPARCALSSLRAGGNRSGADAVATWQTGFPFAVDFAPGYPCYRPHAGAAVLLGRGEIDVPLLVGSPAGVPPAVAAAVGQVTTIAIGPRVSAAPFRPKVAIDTGAAGIHEGGIAFRMDDVPLPLRPALSGPSVAADVVRALAARLTKGRSEEHTSELQSQSNLVCRLLLEKKKNQTRRELTPDIHNTPVQG